MRSQNLRLKFGWKSFIGRGFPDGWMVKNLPANAGGTGDMGSITGLGRSPGGRNSNLLQYSCQENPRDRGAWQAAVHGVTRVRHAWARVSKRVYWKKEWVTGRKVGRRDSGEGEADEDRTINPITAAVKGASSQSRRGNSSSVQFSCSVVSNSLWPHEPQHSRPACPSPTPRVYPNSCPLSWWCHPTISSSVVPFCSCLQSFPASGSFQMSQFFTSGDQSIRVSASASVLPMNIQD